MSEKAAPLHQRCER